VCLNNYKKINDLKKSGIGYKVIYTLESGKYIFLYSDDRHRFNIWYKAKKLPVQDEFGNPKIRVKRSKSYKRGFHIFLTKLSAEIYLKNSFFSSDFQGDRTRKVVKIEYKGLLGKGRVEITCRTTPGYLVDKIKIKKGMARC